MLHNASATLSYSAIARAVFDLVTPSIEKLLTKATSEAEATAIIRDAIRGGKK